MSCSRCATDVSVDGNAGANGLSLPMSALPSKSPSTIAWRFSASARAWRARLSLNGSMSVRMWIWRCCDARISTTATFGSVSSALPPATEKFESTSTSPPWSARTRACSSG